MAVTCRAWRACCRAILCSFTYLVAQIYGVGIITTRMTGISFELGIFLALGGMLVCSFLGGMRAVTWTQVGQFIILIMAYVVPVIWLSVKFTGMALAADVGGRRAGTGGARRKAGWPDDDAERAVRRGMAARAGPAWTSCCAPCPDRGSAKKHACATDSPS